MRSAGLITDTFVNMKSVTVIITNEENEKVPILNVSDLEPYAEGRDVSEFDVSHEETWVFIFIGINLWEEIDLFLEPLYCCVGEAFLVYWIFFFLC